MGKPVKPMKNNLFDAIKNEETAKIYKEFMKKDEIFIPRKFKEKITPQDMEEQKKKNTERQNYPLLKQIPGN